MASIPYIDRQNKDGQSAQSSEVDSRGTFEKLLDENLTPGLAGISAAPAIVGAKTAIPSRT